MTEKEKRILVAVDGTDRSLLTIRYLTQFTPFFHMSVTIMNVFSSIPDSYWDLEKEPSSVKFAAQMRAWKQDHKKRILAYLNTCRQMLVEGGFDEDKITLRLEPVKKGVVKDILAEAQKGYHAVVLRRRGRAFLGDMIIGSVAASLLERLTTTPLIIAGPDPVNQRILVALDWSTSSKRVLDFVGATAAGYPVEVELLHVVRYQEWLDNKDYPIFGLEEQVQETMPPMFNMAIRRLEKWGIDQKNITTKLVTGVHSRAVAIVEEAIKRKFGTIVVGRRDLSKIQAFYMGRVGHKVVQVARKNSIWVVS